MPLNSGLLDQAKTAEARVIDAEHEAEVARADFHRAVRRLQLAGASLREIADALGLSHQRIHQIVASAGGSRRWRSRRAAGGPLLSCSFCGRDQKHVKALITGPGVDICDRCIRRADAVLPGRVHPGGAGGGPGRAVQFLREAPLPGARHGRGGARPDLRPVPAVVPRDAR